MSESTLDTQEHVVAETVKHIEKHIEPLLQEAVKEVIKKVIADLTILKDDKHLDTPHAKKSEEKEENPFPDVPLILEPVPAPEAQKVIYKYGCIRSTIRTEHITRYPFITYRPRKSNFGIGTLPASVDLRGNFPPVYNQGPLSSCTANALLGSYQSALKKSNKPILNLSRLYLYWYERALDRQAQPDQDIGAQIHDGILVLMTRGAPLEDHWPYDPRLVLQKPPDTLNESARINKVLRAEPVAQNLNDLKACLAEGISITCGVLVYPEIESQQVARSGFVPYPWPGTTPIGGHAILLCGYCDKPQDRSKEPYFIFRNSWGPGWGTKGYGYIPYRYILDGNLTFDFWTINNVQADGQVPAPSVLTPTSECACPAKKDGWHLDCCPLAQQ